MKELINEGFMTYDAIRYGISNKGIKQPRQGRRYTPALIAINSLPSHIIAAVKAKYGELEAAPSKYSIRGAYREDQQALDFYRKHTLPNGEFLAEEYIQEYTINASLLKAIRFVLNDKRSFTASRGKARASHIWPAIANEVTALKSGPDPILHTLPKNPRRLKERLDLFEKEGYINLVSGKFCNKNTEKIPEEAKLWLLTRWSDNVKKCASLTQLFREYNEKASVTPSWTKIKTEKTICNFIYSEEIQSLWYAHRHGELISKEKFSYIHKTLMPTMRDSIWYSDGTKLNLYYQYLNSENKRCVGTLQVYEVMDAYSEVLLGYHISKSEDYEAQFFAYKMALNFAKYKPFQISYDNQGGHKKLESSDLLKKLAHLAIRTQPYNGRSKTIENVFSRFQQQVLKQETFYTGQNITTKTQESRINQEFFNANLDQLPTEQEMRDIYAARREEWNNMPHPKTGIPRIEMYRSSVNPQAVKVEIWDIVDMFYVTRQKEVTCTAWGITFTEKKIKYDFMVYKDGNMPDLDWLQKNIDKKFVVKFDPSDLSMIFLYERTAAGLKYNTVASTKVAIHRGKQEQEEWEAQYIKDIEIANKQARINRYEKMEQLQREHGTHPEDRGFRSPAIAGIQTSVAAKRKAKKSSNVLGSIGVIQKAVSNADIMQEEDFDPYEYAKRAM
ncbi:MAG: kinase [Bacteroidetes bacterium HGW-Bacteroidetes-7]|jgi:hypothetical protein|nr:MAG: kinase [Bacteroidetes bacterium HGW-Bacteroidetes-7]